MSKSDKDWLVYVAPGMVTTGWLWFKKEIPVVYAYVTYLGEPNAENVRIRFGNKLIK